MSLAPRIEFVTAPPLQGPHPLSQILIDDGLLSKEDAKTAEEIAIRGGIRLADVLTSRFGLSELSIADAFSTLYQTTRINPCETPPDLWILKEFGPSRAIQMGILPWRKMGENTVFLTDKPDHFDRHISALSEQFGRVRMAISTRDHLQTSVTELCSSELAWAAETKTPLAQSSRNWHVNKALLFGLCLMAILGAAFLLVPSASFVLLCLCAIGIMIINATLKVFATIACLRRNPDPKSCDIVPARLPKITLFVPMFRETEIAEHLLTRLREIDYPHELLDVCLVTESDDVTTRDALGKTVLPTWMRPIVVPQGSLRTKPRALNFAMDFAQGSIIGVYDAEDAPAPDQLRVVAAHFANSGPEVACLQGVLDYYNDSTNWLTRCFTIEYATWFRIVLPGLERLGLVVPLGGTTLFFRRDILEKLGGWDAHNVTEDADLGVRLARAGYRTELINSVTQEEANGRCWPWVKQRSRWLKGYAITYAVHMRSPRSLWRELGMKRFVGLQILFAGTLAQFALAPVLLSFWLIPFGFSHPFLALVSPVWFWSLVGVFFTSEILNFAISAIALRAAKKLWLLKWAITLQFYFPLAAIAAYKGLIELMWKPFYWDKTMHGVLLPKATNSPPPQPEHQA